MVVNIQSCRKECGSLTTEIDLVDPIKYNDFIKFEDYPQFNNMFVYLFKYYQSNDGFQYIIQRSSGNAIIRVADFNGNILDPAIDCKLTPYIKDISENYLNRILLTIKYIGITQAIFYFAVSDCARLVDMRLSLNKMCGPGYLIDFFGKQGIPLQEQIGKPVILNEEEIERIRKHCDPYLPCKMIIKPSVFKTIMQGEDIVPLYGVLNNEIKTSK